MEFNLQLKIEEGVFLVTFLILCGLFFILCFITYRTIRSLRLRKTIRKRLQYELRTIRSELARWEHHPGQQFEILKPVYNAVSFAVKRHYSENPKRVDDLIERELNRLIKNSWSRSVSFLELILLRLVAFVLVIACLFQGSFVFVTYQETPLKVNLDSISQWFETSNEEIVTSAITIPKSAVKITPKAAHYMMPAQVTSTRELGQALAYHISRHEQRFVIRYIGDANSFTRVTGEAWKWLQYNEPYLMRLYNGGGGQSLNYGSYIDYEVTVDYTLTKNQTDRIQKKVKQIVQKIPKKWSDDKKVRYVNDYIVRHTAYKLKSKESPYTPYSILFNREGVCEGYALTTYLLLKSADIEVRYIAGHAGGGLHAWNMVKLKGQWYHLDTTWNDPLPDRPNEVQEDYLLVSDRTLSKDHTWDKKKYPQTAIEDF